MPQKKKVPETTLISMIMDGVELQVHPDCVAAHEQMGWLVIEPTPEKDADQNTKNA